MRHRSPASITLDGAQRTAHLDLGVGSGVLLALIEGVGIMLTRFTASLAQQQQQMELEVPPQPSQQQPQLRSQQRSRRG